MPGPILRRTATRATFGYAALFVSLLASCGAETANEPPPKSPQQVGKSQQLGAPKDTRYQAEIEAEHGRIRVVVREVSRCDVIPIETVIENGETRWVAGQPTSSQPCNQRVTRNGTVSLEVAGNTYRLGEPNSNGELETQLSDRMAQALYAPGEQPPIARVTIRDKLGVSHELGTIELTQLRRTDQRLDELLSEFRRLLDRPQQQLSGSELARGYELYEQLAAFDSSDPRIAGLMALFMDRLYQRKASEATETFKNNLEALNAAKDILKNNTALVLPGYVLGALNSGSLDARSVAWARSVVALSLRKNRDLCTVGNATGFRWATLQLSPPPPESRLAFQLLRFAYDNPYETELTALCQRLTM